MAGSPKKRAFKEQLVATAKTAGVEPLEYVLRRIEDGELATELAEELGASYGVLKRWVNAQPDGRARWQDAMKERTDVLAEQTVIEARKLQGTEVTKEEIAASKLLIEQLTFLAKSHNRQVYGNDAAQVNVNVSVGGLHLDALRQTRALALAHVTPQLESGEPDVEVVKGESPEGESA